MSLLSPSAQRTYRPFKDDCSYLALTGGDERGINAVRFWEEPFEAVAPIKDHVTFYRDRA